MRSQLRRLIQRFPASIILLILLLASMWGNRECARDIEELCTAGKLLYDEGSVAWEGLEELAPGNLRRDEQRWHWASNRLHARCPASVR